MSSLRQQKRKAYDSLAGRLKRGKSVTAAARDMRRQGYRFSDSYIRQASREIAMRRRLPDVRIRYRSRGRTVEYTRPRSREGTIRYVAELPTHPSRFGEQRTRYIYAADADLHCNGLFRQTITVSFGDNSRLTKSEIISRSRSIIGRVSDRYQIGTYDCENPTISPLRNFRRYYEASA